MPCDSCGHPKIAHKEMTLAVYFCSQCQKVESQIAFTSERKIENDAPKSLDLLSELYWNYKAFRR